MTALTSALATCHTDISIAAQASQVTDKLAEAFETFADKLPTHGLRDIYEALVEWDELSDGLGVEEGIDLMVKVTTEDTTWEIDFLNPLWLVDVPMSIFHNKLIFKSNLSADH